MSKKIVYTEKAPKPIGPYSQAVLVENTMFLSGQIPIDPSTNEIVQGNIKEQTTRVLENIKAVLESEGFSLEDVVKVTVFLKDINLFGQFNEVYGQYFSKNPPARTTVEVSNLPKGVLIEIDAIAVKSMDKKTKP